VSELRGVLSEKDRLLEVSQQHVETLTRGNGHLQPLTSDDVSRAQMQETGLLGIKFMFMAKLDFL